MFFLLFLDAKVYKIPCLCKKKTKKTSFFSFFHSFIFPFQIIYVPLHRFFAKHIVKLRVMVN